MAYLASIHRPSSVRHALKLKFLSAEEETVVVAKANRLEFYAQLPDDLALQTSKAIYGKVTMLNRLCPAGSETDHLFVGTDRFMYFTLSWDPTTKQLRTEKSYHDLAEKSARDSQTGDRCHIDPTRRFMTLEIYEGVINVLPISKPGKQSTKDQAGSIGEPIPVRIPELFVRSSAFLQRRNEKDKAQLALLYEDQESQLRIKIRDLDHTAGLRDETGTAELEVSKAIVEELEEGSSHLIPLRAPIYGFLLLGETSISYADEPDYELITEPLEEATIWVAWEQIDDQRFILADDYGKLYLLMIVLNRAGSVDSWKLDLLGETSRASTLVYLDGGRVFVGSHQGNSQVIQIKERSIEVLQEFPNIAPILDFTVMDMGNRSSEAQVNEYSSGQARIVTGSGAFKDGSLRSVRSGVGLEELGSIGGMQNVTDVFSLSSNTGSGHADVLVVSFITHTRVFAFATDGEVEEVQEYSGLDLSQQSLLVRNTPDSKILQVTGSAAVLIDPSSTPAAISRWTSSDSSIAAAVASDDHLLLSISGKGLANLSFDQGQLQEVSSKSFAADSQIACLALSPLVPNIAIVGFWRTSAVALLDLKTLDSIHTEVIEEDGIAVPRSLLIAQVLADAPPTLLVGLADGTVVIYGIDTTSNTLTAKKSIILGTQQPNFRALPRADGLYNIFAICEHSSLIYGLEGRVVFSAITAEDASCVCPFDSEAFPGSIAIATKEELKLALVDEERTTHVQTLAVNETVRRIAYSLGLRAFGLGTIKRTLEMGAEVISSRFKLVDEVAFQELDSYQLKDDELLECCISARLDDGFGNSVDHFLVGSSYVDEDDSDNAKGRILVFEVTSERKLKLILEHSVKGACRCLAMCQGRVIAALVKTVIAYDFHNERTNEPYLEKMASYRTATAPIDISVTGNKIAIADLMKSISIVQLKAGRGGIPDELEEIARHYETSWATAVGQIDDNSYLESDAEGNLIVLNHEVGGFSDDDRRRLRVTSDMLLGEMVNRIRRIDVVPTSGAIVIPRAFLATVEGSIYLVALITPSKQDLLMRLQENMAKLVQSPGHVPFNKYRAFKTAVRENEEPNRFVDGELIERFLDCDVQLQEKIVEGLNVDVEDVRGMVESLRRLH